MRFVLFPKSSSPARLSVPGHRSSAPHSFHSLVDWPVRIYSVTHVSHPSTDKFSPHFVPGSEMIETQEDIYVGSIETDRGVREQVRFYDTRGLRDGAELPRHCFSCTDGYVLVYSTDSRESFQRVELLKKEIDKSKDKKEVCVWGESLLHLPSLIPASGALKNMSRGGVRRESGPWAGFWGAWHGSVFHSCPRRWGRS